MGIDIFSNHLVESCCWADYETTGGGLKPMIPYLGGQKSRNLSYFDVKQVTDLGLDGITQNPKQPTNALPGQVFHGYGPPVQALLLGCGRIKCRLTRPYKIGWWIWCAFLGLFSRWFFIFPMKNPPRLGNLCCEYFLFFGAPLSKSKY